VILPRDNEGDLRELPQEARADMEFMFAERIEDALAAAIRGFAPRVEAVGV
jgi:ATP-dependent Lon protease